MRAGTVLLLTLSLAGCAGPGAGPSEATRPNIVLISSDTLRADRLGVNGNTRGLTPNIDALARTGVNFTHAYAHAPNTAPSHTSLLTSLFPTGHGVFEHGQSLDENVTTLAEALLAAGYATGGFTQLNGTAYVQGFETWERMRQPTPGRGVETFAPALEWVEQVGAQPFFLFLHSYNVHLPYNPPTEYVERFAGDYDGPLPDAVFPEHIEALNARPDEFDDRDRRHVVDLYDAETAHYDAVIAETVAALRQARVWDNTIVVLLSDHGEEFGEHGMYGLHSHSLYEELIRVPLLLTGPGIPSGVVVGTEVQLVDVAPTLLRLAGLESPPAFMGEDLRTAWRERRRRGRIVVAEQDRVRALVWAGYKYFTTDHLYELREDPGETINIAEREPETMARMKRSMVSWLTDVMARTADYSKDRDVRLTPEEERRLRALGYVQ
jgi:arylsulfatase A-like enzyme